MYPADNPLFKNENDRNVIHLLLLVKAVYGYHLKDCDPFIVVSNAMIINK